MGIWLKGDQNMSTYFLMSITIWTASWNIRTRTTLKNPFIYIEVSVCFGWSTFQDCWTNHTIIISIRRMTICYMLSQAQSWCQYSIANNAFHNFHTLKWSLGVSNSWICVQSLKIGRQGSFDRHLDSSWNLKDLKSTVVCLVQTCYNFEARIWSR